MIKCPICGMESTARDFIRNNNKCMVCKHDLVEAVNEARRDNAVERTDQLIKDISELVK